MLLKECCVDAGVWGASHGAATAVCAFAAASAPFARRPASSPTVAVICPLPHCIWILTAAGPPCAGSVQRPHPHLPRPRHGDHGAALPARIHSGTPSCRSFMPRCSMQQGLVGPVGLQPHWELLAAWQPSATGSFAVHLLSCPCSSAGHQGRELLICPCLVSFLPCFALLVAAGDSDVPPARRARHRRHERSDPSERQPCSQRGAKAGLIWLLPFAFHVHLRVSRAG